MVSIYRLAFTSLSICDFYREIALRVKKRMKALQKGKLKRVTAKNKRAVVGGKLDLMIEYDTEFHRKLVEENSNKTQMNLIEQLQKLILLFRYLYCDNAKCAEKNPAEHHRCSNERR